MGLFSGIANRFGYVQKDSVPAPRRTVVIRQSSGGGGGDWLRSFEGGKINRLMSAKGLTTVGINEDLVNHLLTLTARARYLAQNDDYVRRFIKLVKTNVVGPQGLVLRGQVKDTNGQPDTGANDAIETAWKDWSRPGGPEVSGRLSFRDLLNLVIEHIARDGEFFAWKRRTGVYGKSFRVIDPFAVPISVNTEHNGNRVVMGVELDGDYRPVAYHIKVGARSSELTWQFRGMRLRRVPADQIVHIFRPEYADQVRGFTPMASAISRLTMVNGYEEAALVAARIGASKMGFYTSNDSAAPYEGDDEDMAGNLIQEVEPGVFEKLPSGIDFKEFSPAYPNIGYKEFISSVLKGISSGLGVSYPTLSGDLEGVNFSSIRTAVLEDREAWKELQEWLIEQFAVPTYDDWLLEALLRGQIKTKGQSISPSRYEKFRSVTFQGRRWAWVDPQKDMRANVEAVQARIRSVSSVIRELGADPEDVFLEIQRERERMDQLGITPQEALATATANHAKDENDDD